MIYISQGHEKSIGLEILLKCFSSLADEYYDLFTLVVNKNSLKTHLSFIKNKFILTNDYLKTEDYKLNCIFLPETNIPQTTTSMEKALQIINNNSDILLTLPTSKDQLFLNEFRPAGHTEYFRKYFNDNNIAMFFYAEDEKLLLITDHIPLSEVTKKISIELIVKKTSITINDMKKYFVPFDQVLMAGINPHAGENGILGDEDSLIDTAIEQLQKIFPEIEFKGPLSGDTLHFYEDSSINQLKVFMFHDQGLPAFKARHKIMGLNISFGMPFLRISVDHGTAFNLYGQGKADSSGCLYMLETSISAHKRIRNL